MSFRGVLHEFANALSASRPRNEALVGRDLGLRRPGVVALIATDSADHLHLLLSPAPDEASAQAIRLQMRGVTCSVNQWAVGDRALQTYLDLVCDASTGSPLRRPFVAFCEDVISELLAAADPPERALQRTYARWRRFWAAGEGPEFTKEWLKGLFGEVLVLEKLINIGGPACVSSWSATQDADRDFKHSLSALEVKTTSLRPAVVRINSLRQLDDAGLDELVLAVVLVSEVTNGQSLDQLVRTIEQRLESAGPVHYEEFLAKLVESGYRRELEGAYSQRRFSLDEIVWFTVDQDFPRVIASDFARPPDTHIVRLQYSVEVSSLLARALAKTDAHAFLKRLAGTA